MRRTIIIAAVLCCTALGWADDLGCVSLANWKKEAMFRIRVTASKASPDFYFVVAETDAVVYHVRCNRKNRGACFMPHAGSTYDAALYELQDAHGAEGDTGLAISDATRGCMALFLIDEQKERHPKN